jgi:hypothetical protein
MKAVKYSLGTVGIQEVKLPNEDRKWNPCIFIWKREAALELANQ